MTWGDTQAVFQLCAGAYLASSYFGLSTQDAVLIAENTLSLCDRNLEVLNGNIAVLEGSGKVDQEVVDGLRQQAAALGKLVSSQKDMMKIRSELVQQAGIFSRPIGHLGLFISLIMLIGFATIDGKAHATR